MKTKSKISAYILRGAAAAMIMLTAHISLADSATWTYGSPMPDGRWENPLNWTAGGPSNGPGDVATFATVCDVCYGVYIDTPIEVDSIVNTGGVVHYRVQIEIDAGSLRISGAGVITNNVPGPSFFVTGQMSFSNGATVSGNQATFDISSGDTLVFYNTSNAGTTAGGAEIGSSAGGQIVFHDNSSAAGASITNFTGGQTVFYDGADAGGTGANAIENYVPVGYGDPGGQTIFNDNSSAANAYIINDPNQLGGQPGQTIFNQTSSAGNSHIANQGETFFNGNSSAANAFIGSAGKIVFNQTSTAGNATFDFSQLRFNDSSNAGSAYIPQRRPNSI